MADRVVARRYAEAFVLSAEKSQRLEQGLADLKGIAETYRQSKPLRRFLGSPEIAPEEKEQLTRKLWADTAQEETMALVRLLLIRDRVEELPFLAEEAMAVAEERQGILRGDVTTAHPISSVETERLGAAVGKVLGKKVLLERKVDPGILGGVRIRVGSTLLDHSVRTLLGEVREQLKSAKVN